MLIGSIIVAAGVLLVTLRRPVWGVSMVILLWPAYLIRTEVWRVPTTMLELSMYGFAAAIACLLLTRRLRWHWVKISRWTWWLLGAWVVAWAIATVFADDRTAALGALKAWFFDPLLFIGATAVTVQSERDRRTIISALFFSGAHVALAGLIQLFGFRETLQEGRLSSYFAPVANYAAMYMAPIAIVQFGCLLHGERRGVWWIVFGITIAATIATLSFAAFLALAVGGIFVWSFLPSGRRKKTLLFSGLTATILGLVMLTQMPNFRQHFDFSGRSSGSVRQQIWVTSWALIQQSPLVGVGPNNFESAYRDELPHHYYPPLEWLVAQPHNLFLALWLETGLLGILTFAGLFIYHLVIVWRKVLPRPSERVIAVASIAGLLTIITHGLFDTPYFKNDLALVFLCIAVLPWLGQVSTTPENK